MFDYLWHKLLRQPYRLSVSFYGESTKPPMVFLHGLGASGKSWLPVVERLQQQNYCIVIDLLGFGESPKPNWGEYTADEHLKSIRSTIKKLGLERPYILVGHSLGALLATKYARQFPEYITELWLLSPPVYPDASSITNLVVKARTGLLMKAYEYLRSERMSPETMHIIKRILPVPKYILEDRDSWLPFMRTLEKSIETQTILEDASHLTVKTEVWYGMFDEVVVPENVELLATMPGVTLHKFLGTHDIDAAYGKRLAEYLGLPGRIVNNK